MNEKLTAKDFSNNTEVRWCPGCGDYAILSALQKALPEIDLPQENHVFISGIGCAGRLPYYMNTYGFHTIHGRATAVATGLSIVRDDLCIWVITGDGDALSIGGNHLIHALRRNVNIKILLINNEVYGLTKGQFSPTSKKGQITKTSPKGVDNQPLNPLLFALGSGASFVARSIDKDVNHLVGILKAAYKHQGCAIIEIYQDCNIFNHGAFDDFSLKTNRSANTILLENNNSYLIDEQEVVHDEKNFEKAIKLSRLNYPAYPVPLGILYKENRPLFNIAGKKDKSHADLHNLFRQRASWKVSQ